MTFNKIKITKGVKYKKYCSIFLLDTPYVDPNTAISFIIYLGLHATISTHMQNHKKTTGERLGTQKHTQNTAHFCCYTINTHNFTCMQNVLAKI